MDKTNDNKVIQKLYNGEIEIAFYPNSHQYRKNGERTCLISVTAATGMKDKSQALVSWATKLARNYLFDVRGEGRVVTDRDIEIACNLHNVRKEEAASIGDKIHDWAERYAKGENPEIPDDDPKVTNGILAFLKWVDENEVKFIFAERLIYSRKYDYVGLCDVGITLSKEDHKILHISDYKSANGIYDEMFFQVSGGYHNAIVEEFGDKPFGLEVGSNFIIRFAKEDKFDRDGNLTEEAGTFEITEIPVEKQPKYLDGFLACLTLKRLDKESQAEWYKAHKK